MNLALHFVLFFDKQLPGETSRNSRVIFGDMYISRVRSEHCDWSTEKMRQRLTFMVSIFPRQLNFACKTFQKYCLLCSATLDFSQFKTPKQMKSFVKIKWLMKYTILRWFLFSKNVYQPVEFMNILMLKRQLILRFTSTKFPEMEISGFLEKFIMYEWFQGWRQASRSRTFVTAWRSAVKLPDGLTVEINKGD